MHNILHIFGICADTHTHVDLLDFLFVGGSVGITAQYFKCYIKTLFALSKDYLKKIMVKN
jgi:RecA/RadA recombinase